jgi:lipopolysaccharide export system protein LptC
LTLSLREVAIALALAFLGAAAWWQQRERAAEQPSDTDRQGRPEYIVEQIAGISMSKSGRPERLLQAETLRAYPEGAGTELDRPIIRFLDQEEPTRQPWTVRSERGWVASGEDEVLLEGRVHAQRKAEAEPEVNLYTSLLLILDDSRYAETDRFVELSRGDDWVTAVNGMRLWFRGPLRGRYYGRVRQRLEVAEDDAVSDPS